MQAGTSDWLLRATELPNLTVRHWDYRPDWGGARIDVYGNWRDALNIRLNAKVQSGPLVPWEMGGLAWGGLRATVDVLHSGPGLAPESERVMNADLRITGSAYIEPLGLARLRAHSGSGYFSDLNHRVSWKGAEVMVHGSPRRPRTVGLQIAQADASNSVGRTRIADLAATVEGQLRQPWAHRLAANGALATAELNLSGTGIPGGAPLALSANGVAASWRRQPEPGPGARHRLVFGVDRLASGEFDVRGLSVSSEARNLDEVALRDFRTGLTRQLRQPAAASAIARKLGWVALLEDVHRVLTTGPELRVEASTEGSAHGAIEFEMTARYDSARLPSASAIMMQRPLIARGLFAEIELVASAEITHAALGALAALWQRAGNPRWLSLAGGGMAPGTVCAAVRAGGGETAGSQVFTAPAHATQFGLLEEVGSGRLRLRVDLDEGVLRAGSRVTCLAPIRGAVALTNGMAAKAGATSRSTDDAPGKH